MAATEPASTQPVQTRTARYFAHKHKKAVQFKHEHNRDPQWYRHEKHMLICSWSGRPIWTRYGDEGMMSDFMGVISTIFANFQNSHPQKPADTIRSIIAGDYKFVFLMRGPIYLVAISRTMESVQQLQNQLDLLHLQMMSILTIGCHRILKDRPNYDIRNFMGGTEELLTDLLRDADTQPTHLLESSTCLRLARAARTRVGNLLRKHKTKSLLFAVLLAGGKLVNVVRGKDKALHPHDLMILVNFVTNSHALRSTESWTPICLPKYSETSFLHAYVCYLAEDVCLTLVSSEADDFARLRDCKQAILESLDQKGTLEEILAALNEKPLSLAEVDCGMPELRHFVYRSDQANQYVMPAVPAPFDSRLQQKRLFRRYQRLHARVHDMRGNQRHSFYFELLPDSAMLAWIRPGEFEMYVALLPLVSKDAAVAACTRVLRFIKREEQNLFILP